MSVGLQTALEQRVISVDPSTINSFITSAISQPITNHVYIIQAAEINLWYKLFQYRNCDIYIPTFFRNFLNWSIGFYVYGIWFKYWCIVVQPRLNCKLHFMIAVLIFQCHFPCFNIGCNWDNKETIVSANKISIKCNSLMQMYGPT